MSDKAVKLTMEQRCDRLERLVKALDALLVCYRLLKHPSEALLAQIWELRRDLEQ